MLDHRIHKAIELDQLVLLQIGLLENKKPETMDPETAEIYESIVSRTLELGEILQEIKKKLHTDLLTQNAVPNGLGSEDPREASLAGP